MRHVSVISGYPISTGFCGLTGYQWDPRDRGVTYKANNIFYTFSLTSFWCRCWGLNSSLAVVAEIWVVYRKRSKQVFGVVVEDFS